MRANRQRGGINVLLFIYILPIDSSTCRDIFDALLTPCSTTVFCVVNSSDKRFCNQMDDDESRSWYYCRWLQTIYIPCDSPSPPYHQLPSPRSQPTQHPLLKPAQPEDLVNVLLRLDFSVPYAVSITTANMLIF